MKTINKILIVLRPHYDEIGILLAEQLKKEYPNTQCEFLTFYHETYTRLISDGYECHYMPKLLQERPMGSISASRLSAIDQEIYAKDQVTINLLLQAERFLPAGKVQKQQFAEKHVAILDEIIDDNTLSVSFTLDHFVYWSLCSLVRIKNGAHFTFMPCGIPQNRVFALKTPWKLWNTDMGEDTVQLKKECIERLALPVERRMTYMAKPKVPGLVKSLKTTVNQLSSSMDAKHDSYFAHSITSTFRIKLKNNRFSQKLMLGKIRFEIDYDRLDQIKTKYVYFPIQMEPEMSILFYSPWFKDQVEICRLVAQALPYGWELVLKENPKMIHTREKSFYTRLSEYYNVKFAAPSIDSIDLIRGAECVIAISGTATIEARLLGKNSIAFGRAPASFLLDDYDFAEKSSLTKLTEHLTSGHNKKLANEDWERLVHGTVDVDLIPNIINENGLSICDSSSETVSMLKEYITKSLARRKVDV